MHGLLLIILWCLCTYNSIYFLFYNWQSWRNSRPKHRFMFLVRASFQGAKVSHFFLEGEQGVFLFLTYTCKISVKATITLLHFERQDTIFLTFAADRFEAGIQCQRSVSCLNCASVAFMTQKQVNIWQFCCLILNNSGRSCFQFLSFINIKKPAGRKG